MASIRKGRAYGSARAATEVKDFSWFLVLDLTHDPLDRFELWLEISKCCFVGWTDRVEELFGCHEVLDSDAGRTHFDRAREEELSRQKLMDQSKAMAKTVVTRCDSVQTNAERVMVGTGKHR